MIQETQNLLRTTLAASSTFQTLVGAANAAAALDSIYHDALPKPASGRPEHTLAELNLLRPCAIVYTASEGFDSRRDAQGTNCWHNSGSLVAVIMRNVPEADANDLSKVDTDFRTTVGSIMSDLIDLSETAGYLAATRISFQGPFRTPPKDLQAIGDAQACELLIDWGER